MIIANLVIVDISHQSNMQSKIDLRWTDDHWKEQFKWSYSSNHNCLSRKLAADYWDDGDWSMSIKQVACFGTFLSLTPLTPLKIYISRPNAPLSPHDWIQDQPIIWLFTGIQNTSLLDDFRSLLTPQSIFITLFIIFILLMLLRSAESYFSKPILTKLIWIWQLDFDSDKDA